MNKTAKTIKEVVNSKETLELIRDFFRSSTATNLKEFDDEIRHFAFNISRVVTKLTFDEYREAISLLDSLNLNQLLEAREVFGIKLPDNIDLNRCYFPLRKMYLKKLRSKHPHTLYFTKKGKLYDLDCASIEGNQAMIYIREDTRYIEKRFTVESNYIYLEE